jgi:maleamate amidohydrolase
MSDNYSKAGYGALDDGLGTKPAVLVVDLQVAFTDPRFPLGGMPMVHAATDKTAELLKVARQHAVPVAKCYTAYGSQADMPRWKVKPVREEFFYGHPCTAMDPRIHDEAYDFTFCKSAPSIFFLTPLITFLAKHQVDTVIITGCTTSGCIRASIIDAFSFGFRVAVPEDCCGDGERDAHEANLRDCGRRYCDITDAAAMKKYLAATAAKPYLAATG